MRHSDSKAEELGQSSAHEYTEEAFDKSVLKSEAARAHDFALEHGNLTWTLEEEKKVLLKIDLWILPMTFVSGLLTYADSGAYGVAALFNMIQDLKLYKLISIDPLVLDLTKFSWSSSITFFGGMVFTFPLLLLAQKISPAKIYGFLIVYSGVFGLLMLAAHNYAGTLAIRFFYGAQLVVQSLFVIYCSSWYTQKEQPIRLGIIASGSAFGSLLGQGIDLGAVKIGGAYAASPWKWMYVIIGSITAGWGLLYLLIIPDTPTRARFLNERQKAIAIERIRRNGTGMQSTKFEVSLATKALLDPQLWALVFVSFTMQFAASALGSFGGLLTASFGYEGVQALKFLMPASGIAIVVLLLSGTLATYLPKSRLLIAIACVIITILGNLLLWKSPRSNKGALLAGLYLSIFFYGTVVQMLSILTSNVGVSTRKTVLTSCNYIFSTVGAVVAPFAYKGEEAAKGFPTGIITVLVFMIISVFVLIALRIYYVRYNKKADEAMAAQGIARVEDQEALSPESGFGDVSEKHVPHFRYQI